MVAPDAPDAPDELPSETCAVAVCLCADTFRHMTVTCGDCQRSCHDCVRNFRTSESLHSVCQVVRPPPSPTPTGAWQIVQNGVSAPQRMQPPGGRLKGRSRRSLHRCCSTSLRPLRHTMCGNRLTPPDTQPCDLCKDNDDVFPYMERSCVAACGRGVSRAAVGHVPKQNTSARFPYNTF